MSSLVKKLAAGLAAAILMVTLAGCSTIISTVLNPTGFDASDYVKSILDSTYLEEYDDYMKITEATLEQSVEEYESKLDSEAAYFEQYFDIRLVSEETHQQIKDLYKDVYKNAKYEVVKSTKSDDSYLVEVKFQPMDFIQKMNGDMQEYIDQFNARFDAGEFDDLDEQAYEDEYAAGVLKLASKHKGNIGYEEEKTLVIKVQKDSDGVYFVSDDDYMNMDNLILTY